MNPNALGARGSGNAADGERAVENNMGRRVAPDLISQRPPPQVDTPTSGPRNVGDEGGEHAFLNKNEAGEFGHEHPSMVTGHGGGKAGPESNEAHDQSTPVEP